MRASIRVQCLRTLTVRWFWWDMLLLRGIRALEISYFERRDGLGLHVFSISGFGRMGKDPDETQALAQYGCVMGRRRKSQLDKRRRSPWRR